MPSRPRRTVVETRAFLLGSASGVFLVQAEQCGFDFVGRSSPPERLTKPGRGSTASPTTFTKGNGRAPAPADPVLAKDRGANEYRYYRCSARDKHGQKECAAKALPAGAIEEYVAERLAEATASGGLAADVKEALDARLRKQRAELEKSRAGLPGQVATLSANASRYAEEMMRLEGRARAVVETKLNAESEKLAAAERMLADVERKLVELTDAEVEGEWVCKALGDFASVWALMTPENRGRLLRALVTSVKVDESSGTVELHLVKLAAGPEAKRLDGEPKEAA